jgi:hypothetical protein
VFEHASKIVCEKIAGLLNEGSKWWAIEA